MTDRRTTAAARPLPPVRGALRALLVLVLVLLAATPSAAVAADDDPPSIGAPAAIAVEISTGDVVYERRANSQRSIASTTKLMTALLAFEYKANLDATYAVPSYAAAPAESLAGLRGGDRMTMRDLLAGMLVPSGNDAAYAIAATVGGSVPRFVRLMNARSKEIGLDARFRNPIGLDAEGHHASAADLVKLTLLLRQYPEFRRIVNSRSFELTSATPRITVENRNLLVQDVPWVDGVKTGHTRKSGYALVGSGKRHGVSVVTVVLGASSESERVADSLALLRYASGRYVRAQVLRKDAVVTRLPLRYRDEQVSLVAKSSVRRTSRRDEKVTTRVVGTPGDVEGPIARGTQLGTIEVVQRGKVVARVPAVTAADVAQATFWERADEHLARRGVQLMLLAAVVCLAALLLLARRTPRWRGRANGSVS